MITTNVLQCTFPIQPDSMKLDFNQPLETDFSKPDSTTGCIEE